MANIRANQELQKEHGREYARAQALRNLENPALLLLRCLL